MNPADYEILVNTLPAGSRPPEFAVKLLEDTCERTGLDWKLRHLYLMNRGGKWGVTLSIDGFRLIGAQDVDYAGQEGPFWVTKADGTWTDIPPDGKIYAAKVGVKHKSGITTWGVARYQDYATGKMWEKFPSTMSAKCAEMLAWRKAFPGRLGGLYGVEEMAQADKGAAKLADEGAGPPAPATTPEHADYVKNGYIARLGKAQSRDEVTAIGREIASDKSLPLAVTVELHGVYTKAKESY